ncbi:MAG: hypothetical protein F6K28_53080 [Microcoleus sp. SIO2G3]|nr:hypothetical protein [Microcoleus sp. SIO2G3]
MKAKHCKRLLEALEVGTVIASLYACSPFVGIVAAPLAVYCLIIQYRDEDNNKNND